jgi:phytoene synthase
MPQVSDVAGVEIRRIFPTFNINRPMKLSDDTLKSSYAFCRRLSRCSGSNFYLSFLLLPEEKRKAMDALYAFMRHTDDMVDRPAQPTSDPDLAIRRQREQLRRWRTSLENALAHDYNVFPDFRGSFTDIESAGMSLLPALVDGVKKFHIPEEHLYAVLEGVEMDLDRRRYETFEELKQYCGRVASAVGLACIHIWGFRGQGTAQGEAALEAARQAGIALQLTNILRDIKADAAADRVYLPLEDIRSCGYSIEELKEGIVNEAFHRLMALQINRSEQFYRGGCKLMDYLSRDGRRIFGLMISTYRMLLEKISGRPGDVFSKPIRLGKFERLFFLVGWALLPSIMRSQMQ